QEYGPTVIAAPTATGFNRVAWIMPFVALALGIAFVVYVVRSWKNRPARAPPPAKSRDLIIKSGVRSRPDDPFCLRCHYARLSLLRLLFPRRSLCRRRKNAPRLSPRAQGSGLREPARSEFRIQGRQGAGRGLPIHAHLARRGSGSDHGGNCAAGAGCGAGGVRCRICTGATCDK